MLYISHRLGIYFWGYIYNTVYNTIELCIKISVALCAIRAILWQRCQRHLGAHICYIVLAGSVIRPPLIHLLIPRGQRLISIWANAIGPSWLQMGPWVFFTPWSDKDHILYMYRTLYIAIQWEISYGCVGWLTPACQVCLQNPLYASHTAKVQTAFDLDLDQNFKECGWHKCSLTLIPNV